MDLLRKYLLSSVARMPENESGSGAGASEGGNQPGGDAGAAAGGDAGKGAGGAGQGEGAEEFVTLADDDDAEEGADDEDGESDDDGEGGEGKEGQTGTDGAPKRKSGSAKWRDRARRAERELEELRRGQAPRRAPAESGDDKDLVEPKESDFPNDYLAYEKAHQQWMSLRKAIRDENRRVAQQNAEDDAAAEQRERVRTYNRRLDGVKDRIPDFAAVMASAKGTEIRDDVMNGILDSPKGPLIAYHLAKNPDKVAELNRMSPLAAAREIGRLEARIRGPQAKKATNAPAPKAPLKGGTGGAPAKDLSELSVEDYFAKRNADEGIK